MSRLPAFRPIDSALPFDQMAGSAKQFQGLATANPQDAVRQLGDNYANSYNSALAMNQALYKNIDQGYRNALADQTSAQDAIAGGYGDLYNTIQQRNQAIQGQYGQLSDQVLNDISGIGATRAQDIRDAYTRSLGAEQQRLINSGLGNSTVLGATNRGLMNDRERNLIANSESVAGLRANYRSQLGQAGLGFQERGLGAEANARQAGLGYQANAAAQNAALLQNQLGWMNTVQAPYPDAALFAQLAQQYGSTGQANADRGLLLGLAGQTNQLARQQQQKADQGMFTSSGAGGGLAYGSGGFSPPMANYGGGAEFVNSGGAGFFAPPSVSMGGAIPDLVGAGGGLARGYAGDVAAGYAKPFTGPLEDGVYYSDPKSGFGAADAGAYKGAGGSGGFGDYLGGMFGY